MLLYTVGNYHWYLKQRLDFAADSAPARVAALAWDPEQPLTLHVVLAGGAYAQYTWGWCTDEGRVGAEHESVVAVIDGGERRMRTHTRTHTHAHTYTRTPTYTHSHAHTHTHVSVHTHTHTHTHTFTHTHTHSHTHTHVHTYTHTHTHTHTFDPVCITTNCREMNNANAYLRHTHTHLRACTHKRGGCVSTSSHIIFSF